MEKYTFSDEFISLNSKNGTDLDNLLLQTATTEVKHQLSHLCRGTTTPHYNVTEVYEHLVLKGRAVKGRKSAFNIQVGKYRLSFTSYDCQIDGVLPNKGIWLNLFSYAERGVIDFLERFTGVMELVEADLADVEARFHVLQMEVNRAERLRLMEELQAKAVLEDFFNKRGYKYTLVCNKTDFNLDANAPNGHSLRLNMKYTVFDQKKDALFEHIRQQDALFRNEPVKIRVK